MNYHKHYKTNLNTIVEENSLAEYSELYDIKKIKKTVKHKKINYPKTAQIYLYYQLLLSIAKIAYIMNPKKCLPAKKQKRKKIHLYLSKNLKKKSRDVLKRIKLIKSPI